MSIGHEHCSQGIEGQVHISRSRSWTRGHANAVGPTLIEERFSSPLTYACMSTTLGQLGGYKIICNLLSFAMT